jgi:hypothetical protein
MFVGRTLLRIRQRFGHGLRTAYYRDVVRPRILRTPPITGLTDDRCEIHVLTSAADWLNLVWALKSFYRASGRRYALCIHDDGTLTIDQTGQAHYHFPEARLISRTEADSTVLPTLTSYPRCAEFRKTNLLAPKVFDFAHYLRSDRMLLLDSDVLFFDEPNDLLTRIENPNYRLNTVNADVASAYTVDPVEVERQSGVRLIDRFNSGLGLIHKDSLGLDWIEEFLGLPGIIGHFWRIEQTLFALCSSRFGVELLPSEYDVRVGPIPFDVPVRHYVGEIRHLLYRDGIRELANQGLLRA